MLEVAFGHKIAAV